MLTESLVLGMTGGLLGLTLAYWGVDALRALVPANTPRMEKARIDPAVLAFTFGVSLLTGLIFGLAPAWHMARIDLREIVTGRGSMTSNPEAFSSPVGSVATNALAVTLGFLTGRRLPRTYAHDAQLDYFRIRLRP